MKPIALRLMVFGSLIVFLTGCTSQADVPVKRIPLLKWVSSIEGKWKAAELGQFEPTNEVTRGDNWAGCDIQYGYADTDFEIGFCDGFKYAFDRFYAYFDSVSNYSNHIVQQTSENLTKPKLPVVPSRNQIQETCMAKDAHETLSLDDQIFSVLNDYIIKDFRKWQDGCSRGYELQSEYQKLYFDSEEFQLLIDPKQSSPESTPHVDYNSNFVQIISEGHQTGNRLYDSCVSDAKTLLKNQVDPNSTLYRDTGNAMMIKIPEGKQKKLCSQAFVDVQTVWNANGGVFNSRNWDFITQR